jgi:hypothetical protein
MGLSRQTKKWMISGTILLVVAAFIGWFIRSGVMPLDGETLERFQEANSREVAALQANPKGMTYYQMASTGFRRAVTDVGYYPSETLVYWLSPKFRDDIMANEPTRATDLLRLTESLIKVALGDGSPDDEFETIITAFTPAVREAARARRGVPAAP